MAQKINADFLCDEENPLLENQEERSLSMDLDKDLLELSECISEMRNYQSLKSSPHPEALIKRYQEIHFDYSSEYKNTAVRFFNEQLHNICIYYLDTVDCHNSKKRKRGVISVI